ncbi:HD-GYP domain-containing protein [Cohnella suwonensis]|uniref:HD-GYP domain-containing protein n=1 Tax=Cohnella suwonensis TaxID=696072 RepID=A0ABW0LZJ8_9BACL
MRLVSIANCYPGMEIAKPIFTDAGTVLLGIGVALTERMIDGLKGRNVPHLYIKDKATDDLEIIDDITAELRIEAAHAIQDTFAQLQSGNNKVLRAVNPLNADKLQKVFKDLIYELRTNQRVLSLLTNVFVHDNYIFSHSINVAIYTLAMAVKAGYNEKQLNEIAIGGVFHDIGKWRIPLDVLNKKGRLSPEEFDLIKNHPADGFELLRNQPGISLLSAHCAYQHHEKLDGSGYPRGLIGDEIHPYAKMMAVADVYDALTSSRSYRKAMLPHEAMEVLFAETNTHFDAGIIQTFRQSVASYPIGVTVRLNSGETAVVAQYLFHSPSRPIVRVIKDPYGQRLTKPYDLDLSKNLTVMITECDAIM